MPQVAEPHMTVEKKDKPSLQSPRQTRQPDGSQEMMPDGDMTKRHEDTTDDHQATADAQTATPRPGAAETDGGHTPTCHQLTTRGRDRPGQLQKSEKRWEKMERARTDNPRGQASGDGSTTEAAAAKAERQTQPQGKQKPKDAPAETDKEDDDDKKQNERDDNIPRSEHAESTQNSQPQPIAHISKMQGRRMKTATHQERGGTHPPEVVNRARQRAKDPANPTRVQDILDKISIGPDLMGAQWARVMDLIRGYPDIFPLSLSEVFPVDFTQHKLKIDPDTMLPKKAYQRPMAELQRKFFSDIMIH